MAPPFGTVLGRRLRGCSVIGAHHVAALAARGQRLSSSEAQDFEPSPPGSGSPRAGGCSDDSPYPSCDAKATPTGQTRSRPLARKNDRMLRPPHLFKVAGFRGLLRRKVRLERRGFVGPVIASAEASTSPLRDVSRPRAPRCSSPIRASQRAPAPKDAPALSLRPRALETCNSPLSQPLAFKLAQCGEDCELQSSARRAEVQTFLQRNKRNVQRLEILEDRQEMFQSRPIRSSAQHTTTLIFARRASSSNRSRPGRRSFAPLISSVYSAWMIQPLRLAVATELEELVLAGLGSVGRADAGVDGGLHGNTAVSLPGALRLSLGMILTVILSSCAMP